MRMRGCGIKDGSLPRSEVFRRRTHQQRMGLSLAACLLCLLVSAVAGQSHSSPTRNASDYRLRYRQPSGCEPDDCDFFVGIDTNEGDTSFLDFYLVGKTTGWVAVGFSETPNMFKTDVVGCSTEQADKTQVMVIDTYNPADAKYNAVDDSERNGEASDVVAYSKEYVNGTIRCVFSRKIEGLDPYPQDLPLNKTLYLEFGRGSGGRESAKVSKFSYHDLETPVISSEEYNPATDSTEIENTQEVVIEAAPSAPIRNASDYRLRYRQPSGCDPDDCDFFVGIDTNEGDTSFLDFYLVGKTTGWVAVGFSETPNMFKTDVVGCSTEQADKTQVMVIDTYNPADAKYNVVDDSESNGVASDVVAYSKEYVNGTIRCVFSRKIEGLDPYPQDLPLNKKLYLEFGRGSEGRESAMVSKFSYHDLGTPVISRKEYNPATDSTEIVNAQEAVIDKARKVPPAPTRNASDYRLRYREPSGCEPDDCDFFVGIDTNEEDPSFLDFYLVGKATGWVAVGFSKTPNMFKTDVVGCSVDKHELQVLAIDTYNPSSPDKFNVLDDSEVSSNGEATDIVQHSGEFADNTITCVFSREIEGLDPCPQDMLLNKSLYLQFGRSTEGRESVNVSQFHYHDVGTPVISKQTYNPASSSGEIGVSNLRSKLIVIHAVLMMVAWPLLSFVAIFFAAWMKPALPSGQWFQVHRAFNFASLLVAVVAFIVVFVAHKDQPTPGLIDLGAQNKIGTAHFALGIVIMALHLVNPLISLFRCKPNNKHRWIYILVHGLIIGYGVQILAYVSIGCGIARYDEELTDHKDKALLWLYVAIAVFSVLVTFVLFALFSGEAVVLKRDARSIAPTVVSLFWKCCNKYTELEPLEKMELEDSRESRSENANANLLSSPSSPPAPKKPSPDSPLRWGALVVVLTVLSAAVIALIVLMITRSNLL